jgi:AraC-like DNA-binding protein/mannose-6-phosphate isomerase-like protein (cupin superfamily)
MAHTAQLLNPIEYVESLEGLTVDSMPCFAGQAFRYEAHEGEEWHYHDVGHLLYAISGTMRVSTRDNIVLIPPTMAAWLPPGIHHQLEPLTSTELGIIFARPDALPIEGSNGRLLAVSPLLRELILSFVSPSMSHVSKRRRTALNEIFSAELAESTEIPLSLPIPSDKRIRPMADEALVNPGEITSIAAWAGKTPASRKTVERLFLEETGLLPSQWLRQARLIKAVAELAQGRSVSSVALDLGYATPSSFTYMFRQALGVPPSKFLRGSATLTSRFGQ